MFNKKIWIVGASFGIGEELVYQLSKYNNSLILSARTTDKLNSIRNNLPNIEKHTILPLDVTDSTSIKNAFSTLKNTQIDLIIYCSGIYETGNVFTTPINTGLQILNTNLIGALNIFNMFIPKLITQSNGSHLLIIGSAAGYVGLPNSGFYGISKAALIHLAEQLKLDLKLHKIKVQISNPGFVKTRLTNKNSFPMPFITSADKMAKHIIKHLTKNTFDINYPKPLTVILKIIKLLPYYIQFKILNKL